MKKELLYKDFAKYYDLIYSYKDYKTEAERLDCLIKDYLKGGIFLHDIACGTGSHLFYLKDKYICSGSDKNIEMVIEAKKKLPDLNIFQQDMLKPLKLKYHVIICMFSSISYLQSYNALQTALDNAGEALLPKGVIIIEPWFQISEFTEGVPYMRTMNNNGTNIARLSVSKIKGNCSILDIHYLLSEKDKSIKHYSDEHTMALYDNDETLKIMKKAGFEAYHIKPDDFWTRGLFIGVKK